MDEGRGLQRKLLWLIGLRAAVATVLLGAAALAPVRGLALPVDPFATLAAAIYVLTTVYAATLRLVPGRRWVVDLQLGADALLVSALVLVTGGVQSYFATLYVLPIVAASVVEFRRGGLLVAVLSAVLYGGMVVAQYTGALGLVSPAELVVPPGALPPGRVALFTAGLNTTGFVGVALLTGYLSESLRRAGENLERASSQIADLRALSQHVVDSLTGGLATADPAGEILTFNRAAERIVGRTVGEVRGCRIRDVLQLPAPFERDREGADGDPRGRRVEYDFVRSDGTRIDLGLTAAPLLTAMGQAGWIFTFQDLTDAKRLEREAERQKRLAAVGEMAAGISHEIRNPLASMTGSIQILRQELALTEEQAQLMDIVLRESERLNETIRNFLAYARPRPPRPSRIEVGRLLRETATLLRNSPECAEGHGVDVEAEPPEVWVDADESQLRQIVWNLATNGVRAMPDGGRLTLKASSAPPGQASSGGLVLQVLDEGIGMTAGELDRVFHPFRSGFARGTGLGLAIVHRIVSDHGGEVSVSSAPGRGTEVRVFLPSPARPALVAGGLAASPDEEVA